MPSNVLVIDGDIGNQEAIKRYVQFYKIEKCFDIHHILSDDLLYKMIYLKSSTNDAHQVFNIVNIQFQCGIIIIEPIETLNIQKVLIFRGNALDRVIDKEVITKETKILFPLSWEYSFHIFPLRRFNVTVFTDQSELKIEQYPLPNNGLENNDKHLILEIDQSLSLDECKMMLEHFDNCTKHNGVIGMGYAPHIKNTKEVNIFNGELLHFLLYKKLCTGLKQYTDKYTYPLVSLFNECFVDAERMKIQKYNRNEGRYLKHVDQTNNRVLAFIWYLNDVHDGGKTYFHNDNMNECSVVPRAGKLVLFPTTIGFIHSGEMPYSHDKYIITGWVHIRR